MGCRKARPRERRPETAARSTPPWDAQARRHAPHTGDHGQAARGRTAAGTSPSAQRKKSAATSCAVVRQEGPPGLRGKRPVADHVGGDRRLRDAEPEFQELTMNSRRAPQGICGRHRANQGAQLLRDGRPTGLTAALPCPEQAETASMPRDDRFRFDDHEHRSPLVPGSRNHTQSSRSTRASRSRRGCDRSRTRSWCRRARLRAAGPRATGRTLEASSQETSRRPSLRRLLVVGGNSNGSNKNRVVGNDKLAV